MRQKILLLLLALVLAGCGIVTASYVDADAVTYEAIAHEYLEAVEKSDMLPDQKERRRETVRSWKARIDREKGHEKAPEGSEKAPEGPK